MEKFQGFLWIALWYIWLRILLATRYHVEIIHWTLMELPVWTMGTVHSAVLRTTSLIWYKVHTELFHLEVYLRDDTFAEDLLWIPEIEYNALGYS